MRLRFLAGFVFFAVLSVALPRTLWSASAETTYDKARGAYNRLLESPSKQKYRDNWIKVLDAFLQVRIHFPSHIKSASALYMAGKTSLGLYGVSGVKDDAARAISYYDELAKNYPKSSLADDALLLAAETAEKTLNDFDGAYSRYKRIIDSYPSGDMISKARNGLSALNGRGDVPAHRNSVETPTRLTGIRHWSKPGYTRVVLDLEGKAEFTANYLPGKSTDKSFPRLYVDLQNTDRGDTLPEVFSVGDGLLRQIRTGRPDEGRVRVVLDLVSFKDFKVFPLGDPCRVVIDVTGADVPELASKQPVIEARDPKKDDGIIDILDNLPKERPLKVHIPTTVETQRLRRIVVDAGHGGKDPGAVGPSGLYEKDVTLSMAKLLARRLEKEFRCEVILTRSADVFLPLEERTAIANKVGADLFISLHANASTASNAYGVETYFLNLSKNEQAAAVAARENGTSLKEVGDLELILFDLMANAKINESSRLAAEIQKSLVVDLGKSFSKIKDLGVRQGPFYVLLGATMPSVLVEAAFISNKREESRLKSSKFQEKTVDSIVKGVHQYATALKLIASR